MIIKLNDQERIAYHNINEFIIERGNKNFPPFVRIILNNGTEYGICTLKNMDNGNKFLDAIHKMYNTTYIRNKIITIEDICKFAKIDIL